MRLPAGQGTAGLRGSAGQRAQVGVTGESCSSAGSGLEEWKAGEAGAGEGGVGEALAAGVRQLQMPTWPGDSVWSGLCFNGTGHRRGRAEGNPGGDSGAGGRGGAVRGPCPEDRGCPGHLGRALLSVGARKPARSSGRRAGSWCRRCRPGRDRGARGQQEGGTGVREHEVSKGAVRREGHGQQSSGRRRARGQGRVWPMVAPRPAGSVSLMCGSVRAFHRRGRGKRVI